MLILKIVGIETSILKIFLALIAGLILGLEREGKHKSIGLDTCVIISITSCLLTIVSIEFALSTYKDTFFYRADPMRLASQIVSGIGFLGAGVIFRRRDDDVISGLTTAAIVWTAAGFGIGIGAGYYFEVGLGIGLVYIVVNFIPSIMRKFGPSALKEEKIYLIVDVDSDALIDTVVKEVESFMNGIENVKIKGDKDSYQIGMFCFIDDDEEGSIFSKYDKIRKVPGVNKIEITIV